MRVGGGGVAIEVLLLLSIVGGERTRAAAGLHSGGNLRFGPCSRGLLFWKKGPARLQFEQALGCHFFDDFI